MNNLHLSILNESRLYPTLRATALNLYAGRITENEARESIGRTVRRYAKDEAERLEETPATEDQIRACVTDVLDYHMERTREDAPDLPWIVENPLGHKSRFATELDAYGWIHRKQGQSVYHATKYEGWKLYPENVSR